MKFSYYLLNTYVPELDGAAPELYSRWLEQFQAADEFGLDAIWITEHHFRFFGGMVPNPQLLLTAAAQRTRRARLGSSVSLVPMHHPIRIAEDFAMLDLLSQGRVNFGAGRGMSTREYATFGADFQNAQARLPEALDVITRAWTDEVLEWEGEHYRYRDLTVLPKPQQKPHPPVYVTAHRHAESFKMIAARGYHLMTLPWISTNEAQSGFVRLYRDTLLESGRLPENHEVFVMYPAYVGETDNDARNEAVEAWHRWRQYALTELGLDPSKGTVYEERLRHLSYDAMVAEARAVFGGPETCIRNLKRACEALRPTEIGLVFHFGGLKQDKVLKSMERFARFVAPALR
ncbi:MAG TPA: LLM class flavin-dependent oxidoreductase [Candidatus Acidoferrales bacterium]|nr:LLM class flavin-dependent oxidoreductase [Candidatus Acidoferrales bacterium]